MRDWEEELDLGDSEAGEADGEDEKDPPASRIVVKHSIHILEELRTLVKAQHKMNEHLAWVALWCIVSLFMMGVAVGLAILFYLQMSESTL